MNKTTPPKSDATTDKSTKAPSDTQPSASPQQSEAVLRVIESTLKLLETDSGRTLVTGAAIGAAFTAYFLKPSKLCKFNHYRYGRCVKSEGHAGAHGWRKR